MGINFRRKKIRNTSERVRWLPPEGMIPRCDRRVGVSGSLPQSHAEPPTLPIHIRVVANVFVVKDERTASTKERSCSSTNLSCLLVAFW